MLTKPGFQSFFPSAEVEGSYDIAFAQVYNVKDRKLMLYAYITHHTSAQILGLSGREVHS